MLHWHTHFYSTSQIKVYVPFSNYDCSKVTNRSIPQPYRLTPILETVRHSVPTRCQQLQSTDFLSKVYIKMVFSSYKKQRILFFYAKGYKVTTIAKLLREESLPCSRVGVTKFIKTFKETGTIARRVGSGRPSG